MAQAGGEAVTARPQQHLAEVVRIHGRGDGAEELNALISRGLFALNEKKKADRIAEKGTADKTNPHISDAGKCIRAVTYSLLNIPESNPVDEDSLTNFLVGHAVEEAFAQILTAAGAEYVREEKVSIPAGQTVITGRKDFDGITLLLSGAPVELKSTNSRAMGMMLKKGERGRDGHRRQLNLYLWANQKPFGYLVYAVKDATKGEPTRYVFKIDLDVDQAVSDLTELSNAYTMAKDGILPPKPEGYTRSSWQCRYCNHFGTCWEGKNTEALLEKSIEARQ
jgi:hypothetical protein